MGNCCQPEIKSHDMTLVKPSSRGENTKEDGHSIRSVRGPNDRGGASGSTRRVSVVNVKKKDSQSNLIESNHQLMRKEKKMVNIIQIEKDQIHENIEKSDKKIDAKTKEFMMVAFNKHFVMANLSEEEK